MTVVNFDDVLTTGSGGMIGAYIDFGLRPNHQELDVTNEVQVRQYVYEHKPKFILHLAAAADMVRCEKEPLYAYDINVRGTYNLALAAGEIGATMVYVSSSRVFRGDKKTPYTETDAPDPLTQYGRTKHIGEILVQKLVPQHLIVRTAWVFGGGPARDNKFYGAILKQLQANASEVAALNDVSGSPTYAKDFVEEIKNLLTEEVVGIFHVTNTGTATRYDLAKEMTDIFHSDVEVKAVDRNYFAGAETLPTNEAIVSKRCTLRPWKEALSEYINEEWSE